MGMAIDTTPEQRRGEIVAAGGWCAPSDDIVFDLDLSQEWADEVMLGPVRPEQWPAGLTPDDLEWIAAMLHAGEIDPRLPVFGISRGGITWPVTV